MMISTTEHSERVLEASQKVREVLLALSKLISAKTIYSAKNPTLAGFSTAFRKAIDSFFEYDRELQIRVEQYQLIWRNHVVYENVDRSGSVAFVLYKDGVGEITIHSSVTSTELDQFVDIIKEEIHSPRPDADVITKLWQADFGSISYRVLDEDPTGEAGGERGGVRSRASVLQADDHQGLMGTGAGEVGSPVILNNDSTVSIADYLLGVVTASHPHASEQEKEQSVQEMLGTLFTVSSDETRRFAEEFGEDERRDKIALLLKTALEFTDSPADPLMLKSAMCLAERATGYAKEEANARTLSRLIGLLRDHPAAGEDVATWSTGVEADLTNTEFLKSLGKRTDRPTEELLGVLRYYRQVGPEAIPVICELLEGFEKHVIHREACDTLLALAGAKARDLIDHLNVDSPMVARDIVYLFRMTQPERVPPLVKELVHYPDTKVREATLELLIEIEDDEAAPLIATLLDDEERSIRISALSAVEKFPSMAAASKVMSICFDAGTAPREIDERARFFAAAGRLAGEEVVTRLEPMLRKRSWLGFGKGAARELKLLATHALEQVGGDRSESLLKSLAHDADEEIRARANEVLSVRAVAVQPGGQE